MQEHNAPYQIVRRKISDVTQALGYRVELVQQWRERIYHCVYGGGVESNRWSEWRDMPIVEEE